MTTISKEETNNLRFVNLILRLAPSAVREKFDMEIHPDLLQTFLYKKKIKLEELHRKRIISQNQMALLFPIKALFGSS